jgi:hypothetical protein
MLADAERHGRVRAGITSTDVTIALWAIRGIIETTQGRAPRPGNATWTYSWPDCGPLPSRSPAGS